MSTEEILKLKITTDGNGKVTAELLGVANGLEDVNDKTKKAGKSLVNLKSLILGLSTGALLVFSKNALRAADDLGAMASRIGVTAQELQEFDYVGLKFNVTQANMEMGLQRLFRRFGDAQRGVGEATKMFNDLGVSLYDNEGQLKTNEQIFYDVSDAIAAMDDEAAQLSATVKLVDSEAAGMADVFRAGGDEVARLRREAHLMGAVMSEDVVARASEANQQMEVLGKVLKTQFTVALTELTPLLVAFGNQLAAAAKSAAMMNEYGNENTENLDVLSQRVENTKQEITRLEELRERINRAASGQQGGLLDMLGAMIGGYAFGGVDGLTDKIETLYKKRDADIERLMIQNGKEFVKQLEAEREAAATAAGKPIIDPDLLRKTTAELETYRAQIGATDRQLLDMQVRTKLQVAANDEMGASIDQLIDAIIREKEEQARLNQLKNEATLISEQHVTAVDRYTQQTARLNEMLARGFISQDAFNRAIKQTGEELEAAEYGQFFADLSEGAEQLQAATNSWASQFTDHLVDMALTGKASFQDLADSIIRDMMRIAIQQAILQPLFASFGGTAPTVPVGTGHASGGGVSSGTLYPINELRPEVLSTGGEDYLMMGANDGYVHSMKPTGKTVGGKDGAVFTVNVINKNGGTASVENIQPNETGGFDMDVLIDKVDSGLANLQQQGRSSFGNTMARTHGGNRAAGAY